MKDLLPIGSVVTLKEGKKKLMIIGRIQENEKTKKSMTMQDVNGLKDIRIKTIVMYSIMKTLIVCTTLDCRILKNSITDLNWMND